MQSQNTNPPMSQSLASQLKDGGFGQDKSMQDFAVQLQQEEGYLVKEINGRRYSIKPVPGQQGFWLMTETAKTVLPSAGAIGDGVQDGLLGTTTWTDAAMYLCQNLDDYNVLGKLLVLLQADSMKVDGVDMSFDDAFSRRYGDLFELVAFALEENFGQVKQLTSLKENTKSWWNMLIKETKEQEAPTTNSSAE